MLEQRKLLYIDRVWAVPWGLECYKKKRTATMHSRQRCSLFLVALLVRALARFVHRKWTNRHPDPSPAKHKSTLVFRFRLVAPLFERFWVIPRFHTRPALEKRTSKDTSKQRRNH